jgi:hypothetical protein
LIAAVEDVTMFTRNRDRRLDGNIVRGCLAAMPTDPKRNG